jgi:hypothetical protein
MQYVHILRQTSVLAGIIFSISFILTLWPGRRRLMTAAVLYCVGILVAMGFIVYFTCILVWMGYGLSDSGRPNTIALLGLIWPIWATAYPIIAIIFLWPSIPQKKALLWGKVVHVVIGLPIIVATHALNRATFAYGLEVGWLTYTLLWFRIRESYPAFISNSNLK